MLVSEQARVFQVRGLRCSKEPTVLGLGPVRLGMQIAFGRVRRKTAPTGPGHSARKLFLKLTPMVRRKTALTGSGMKTLVDSENKFTFFEIYVRVYDYGIFNRFTQTRA